MSQSVKFAIVSVLCGFVALLLTIASINYAHADAAPQAAGSAVAAPAPSDTLANPVDDPIEAISDLRAAKKQGWAFAIFAAIAMAAAGLGRAAQRWPAFVGLSWVNKHKTVLLVAAAVGAVASAAFNALADGGSWYAVALAGGGVLLAFLNSKPTEEKS